MTDNPSKWNYVGWWMLVVSVIISILVLLVSNGECKSKRKVRTKCMSGMLFYDWKGRPFGMCVPVIKEGDVVKCK